MEDEVIKFTKEQIFELVQIVFDDDKDGALKFLKENIFKELERRKKAKCHKA